MKNIILTAAAIIAATVSAFSQSATETRQIKTTALQIYENYKVVISGLYSNDIYTKDNFMALFSDDAVLYNDIIPANIPAQLSPEKYFEIFKKNVRRIYPVFSDFKMGEPVSVGDKWKIKCEFVRSTRFRTQKDMRYPEWSFNYAITIEMDKKYDSLKKVFENAEIENIHVDNPLKGYFIIENTENMPLVTKSGEALNDWDDEYQSRIFPDDKWNIYDIKIPDLDNNGHVFEYSKRKFSPNRTDTHFYQFGFQRFPKNIFGISVNCSPWAFDNNLSEDYEDINQKNSALSFSIFYGKQIFHKDKATGFVNFGVDLNSYSYKFSGSSEKKIKAEDSHQDTYERTTNVDQFDKKINYTSVSVPVGFEFVHQLTKQAKKPLFLSFELGSFAEALLPTSSDSILKANRCGYYDQYVDGVTMYHYYDYGDFNLRFIKLHDFAFGAFGSVGLLYTLNNSNLIKFKISYKHSINSPLKYEEVFDEKRDDTYKPLYPTDRGLRNVNFGISWVRTIGGKK